MNPIKALIATLLFVLIVLNLFSLSLNNNPYTKAKISMISLSKGDQYFGRLSLWYLFAKAGNWNDAIALESSLDPVDFSSYKSTHNPQELKKYINSLQNKSAKSVEDWLELARVQSILGQHQASLDSLTKAKSLDPVRYDLDQLYYQTAK